MKLQKQSNLVKGILCILAAALSFSVMNVCVKLAGDLPSMQKVFFRNLVAMFCSFIIIKKNGIEIKIEKGSRWLLLARCAFGIFGVVGNFYAVDHLNIADASMLNKMSPFFAIVFSTVLLKEKVNFVQAIAVIGAFIGSLFVIKPTFANAELFASLAGFVGGLGAGVAYTIVRMLKGRVNKTLIVFYFSVFSCIVALPFLIFDYRPMTFGQTAALLGAGLAACGGQFGITNAYTYAAARDISIYDYSQIVFSAALGFIVFGQMPDGWSFLGYVIIIGMALMMFIYNKRRANIENIALDAQKDTEK